MAKWKELGEVPDSEDESSSASDSQESDNELPPPITKYYQDEGNIAKSADTGEADIWDIPLSSSNPENGHHVPQPQRRQSESTPTHAAAPSKAASPNTSIQRLEIHLPPLESSQASSTAENPSQPHIAPERRGQSTELPIAIDEIPEDDDYSLQDDTPQPLRSLRPRKPIQEHPYLLESAQYSKTLKSHGVRPMRIQMEEERRRKQQENDSQEQEYEEESQSTVKDTGIHAESDESQGLMQLDPVGEVDEVDELALVPVESHEASPRRRGIPHSTASSTSSQDEDEDEELPDTADIEKWKTRKRPSRIYKRRASPKESEKNKSRKIQALARYVRDLSPPAPVDDIFDVPPSPPQTSPRFLAHTPIATAGHSKQVTTITPKPSSTLSSRSHTPAPANQGPQAVDLTMLDGDYESIASLNEDEPASSLSSDSGSDSEVRAHMKRIRGVLPASWLRLDQHGNSIQKLKKTARQPSIEHSPEKVQRKGVAQRRQVPLRPEADNALFLDDSGTDDDNDDTILRTNSEDFFNDNTSDPFDDAASVVEDNSVDRMLLSNKRSSTEGYIRQRPRKRRKDQQATFKGHLGQTKRQPKITGLLGRSKSLATTSKAKPQRPRSVEYTTPSSKASGSAPRMPTPPRLSIVDVVEADAPLFIRIAARTANRRSDQGRSSPSRKQIVLGTRKDNLDANWVLQDWKMGTIKQKSHRENQSRMATSRPLQPISPNPITQWPALHKKPRVRRIIPSHRFSQPRRMVKQASLNGFVTINAEKQDTPSPGQLSKPVPLKKGQLYQARSHQATSRPAQLEVPGETAGRHTFDTRKRALDAIYRKTRKSIPNPVGVRLESIVGNAGRGLESHRASDDDSPPLNPESSEVRQPRRRLKVRKQVQPRCVDTTAPQYAHANDPLPRDWTPSSHHSDPVQVDADSGKLMGLGPFGTEYTQHFEVFPLDPGVFFHESTLLGSGRLVQALDECSFENMHQPRGRRVFILDEKELHWGSWDAQTSSELGIVFDWIAEQLHSSDANSAVCGRKLVQAFHFLLDYFQHYVSFPEEASQKLFAGRVVEVLRSFAQRATALPILPHGENAPLVNALSHILVIQTRVLRILQKLDHLSETFELENILQSLAKTTARILLSSDLDDVRVCYDHLQRTPSREGGIRNDQYSVICWVTLIRVLEEARIPRHGFWDVVSSVLVTTEVESITDAAMMERIWRNIFTLLPLGEFDNAGIALQGIRHTIPLEGWSLPQKMLKRVFHLYQSNSRQSPSFNDYCRGILSRCHYLVEQWGWRKCNALIGTVFDFFASQHLSHLRNETVYSSPKFLEELPGTPSLALAQGDKCFHIFLKLLALSIQRLRNFGLIKDVRNLVARVLPNHNRQYEKEKDIHETELAALRNHHDLLCTLFWVAPPDLRPSIQTIEKLVSPGSSHKEACLISLRAWSQLARFVISSSDDTSAYQPFADWYRTMFSQVLEQYTSVESDIQQQFSSMSKDASRNISRDMMNAVIRMNKRGAMDVLHFSMKAFLDVVRRATTLAAASFALKHSQLEQMFRRLPISVSDFDWSNLRVGLDVLDHYVKRIEEFVCSEPTNSEHSWHGEDAIILLERKLAPSFFSMAQEAMGIDTRECTIGPTSDRAICIEQSVALGGRQAARLIHARLSRVSDFFANGKYSIFRGLPKTIAHSSRKYIPLFVGTLIEQGVNDFKDLNAATHELFLWEIVKPSQYLGFENQLAAILKRQSDPLFKDAVVEVGNSPDYSSNRDLFNHTLTTMRKTLRSADASRRQLLQQQFSRSLRSTMDRIKLDLKSLTFDTSEHVNHVDFIRSIIGLIRSQDICPVDSFFYQISREYSPPTQDPRLQTAGILAYGLKLEEGDAKAVSGLFYLLFPNFQLALASGKLTEERAILEHGMGDAHILSFMLSRMFPAIIKTSSEEPLGWIMLDTYLEAFRSLLSGPCIHREFGSNDMVDVLTVFKFVMASFGHLGSLHSAELRPEHLHMMTSMTSLLNLLSPSMTAYLINLPMSPTARGIDAAIKSLTAFTRSANGYLSSLFSTSQTDETLTIDPVWLFEGSRELDVDHSLERNENINRFANHMVKDIRNNWVSDSSTITVRGPSRPQGAPATQSTRGTPLPNWDSRTLVRDLMQELQAWNLDHDELASTRRQALPFLLDDFFF
ncbi:Mus7/MMS22 family-domain-containing protein [Xylariomycetidae sp. FL2044]|nr:Mus7/MMS22 family-domain-containing protein [Xylariomycetidae sp. FL2044]